MRQASQINEDLLCSEAIDDPYTYFGRLRELDPVHWNPLWQGWVVTRYRDVVAVLHDATRFPQTAWPIWRPMPRRKSARL